MPDLYPLEEAAERAGAVVVMRRTGLFLVDADPQAMAAFLAPRPWRERADLINRGVVGDLETMGDIVFAEPDDAARNRELVRVAVDALCASIGLILDGLERVAPRPRTASAMLLFALSSDERHAAEARAWFETDEAERRAYAPRSGLQVLHSLSRVLGAA